MKTTYEEMSVIGEYGLLYIESIEDDSLAFLEGVSEMYLSAKKIIYHIWEKILNFIGGFTNRKNEAILTKAMQYKGNETIEVIKPSELSGAIRKCKEICTLIEDNNAQGIGNMNVKFKLDFTRESHKISQAASSYKQIYSNFIGQFSRLSKKPFIDDLKDEDLKMAQQCVSMIAYIGGELGKTCNRFTTFLKEQQNK